jgi:hypothetical protein
MAEEFAESGGVTRFDYTLPTFSVQPQNHKVYSPAWLLGSEVTLTIDSASNGAGVDFTGNEGSPSARVGSKSNLYRFRPGHFEDSPGDLVTMTDGITTKTTVVTDLAIVDGNVNNDRVWGTAHSCDYSSASSVGCQYVPGRNH